MTPHHFKSLSLARLFKVKKVKTIKFNLWVHRGTKPWNILKKNILKSLEALVCESKLNARDIFWSSQPLIMILINLSGIWENCQCFGKL